MTRRAPHRGGFTLLEVMAAVLVLGLLYAVLAQAAIRGVRAEGVSRRRVEASLIADHYLSDLEAQVALGQMPDSGSQEDEVDPYRVAVSVASFDPTPMLETIEAALKERGGLDRKSRQSSAPARSQEIGAPAGPSGPVEDLLAAPRPGQDARLRRIDVSVTWTEGDHEEHVTRTTFAFDRTGLDALFPKKEVAPSNDGSAGKRKKPGTGQTGSSRSGSQRGASGGSGSPGFNSQPRDFGTPMRQRRRDIRDAIKAGGS